MLKGEDLIPSVLASQLIKGTKDYLGTAPDHPFGHPVRFHSDTLK